MSHAWHFLGSIPLQRLGKLTLREDAWRLPTGDERRYPVLHVGPTVGSSPSLTPGMCCSSASSDISSGPIHGRSRAAEASPEKSLQRRRSASFAKKAAIAPDA